MQLSEFIDQNPMLADLPLRRASQWSEDGDAFWLKTMPLVMERFPQISLNDYWNLTVAEHAGLLPDYDE